MLRAGSSDDAPVLLKWEHCSISCQLAGGQNAGRYWSPMSCIYDSNEADDSHDSTRFSKRLELRHYTLGHSSTARRTCHIAVETPCLLVVIRLAWTAESQPRHRQDVHGRCHCTMQLRQLPYISRLHDCGAEHSGRAPPDSASGIQALLNARHATPTDEH